MANKSMSPVHYRSGIVGTVSWMGYRFWSRAQNALAEQRRTWRARQGRVDVGGESGWDRLGESASLREVRRQVQLSVG